MNLVKLIKMQVAFTKVVSTALESIHGKDFSVGKEELLKVSSMASSILCTGILKGELDIFGNVLENPTPISQEDVTKNLKRMFQEHLIEISLEDDNEGEINMHLDALRTLTKK